MGQAAALDLVRPELSAKAPGIIHPVAVFEKDDRVPLPAARGALKGSIGLLYERRSHSVCTAFCVADAVIATAAHCLYRTSGERPPRLDDFTFRIPGKGDKAMSRIDGATRGSAPQHVMTGSMSPSVQPPIEASHDWALVQLSQPLCKGSALPVSRRPALSFVSPSPNPPRVYHVAFHRDFANWQLAFASPCAPRRDFDGTPWSTIARDFVDPEAVLLHTCDTGGASSGSPLLIDGPSGPEVVGINVGTYVQTKVLMQNGKVVHRYRAESVANTAVASQAFAGALDTFHDAPILATRPAIRELQKLLAVQGYFPGVANGIYGAELHTAIVNFERSEGRPATGLATETLLKRLTALRAERYAHTPSRDPARIETQSVGEAKQTASAPNATAPNSTAAGASRASSAVLVGAPTTGALREDSREGGLLLGGE